MVHYQIYSSAFVYFEQLYTLSKSSCLMEKVIFGAVKSYSSNYADPNGISIPLNHTSYDTQSELNTKGGIYSTSRSYVYSSLTTLFVQVFVMLSVVSSLRSTSRVPR